MEQLEGFKGSARGGVLEGVDGTIVEKGAVVEWKRKAETFGEEVGRKEEVIAGLVKQKGDLELEVEELKAELALTRAKMQRAGVTDIGERKATASTTRATASTPSDTVVHLTGHHEISTTCLSGPPLTGSMTSGSTATLTLDPAAPEFAPHRAPSSFPSSVPPPVPLDVPLATPVTAPLPPIPLLSGESLQAGETFGDWQEQFESVARLSAWSDHCKLVHLTSRLRGKTHAFYRACTLAQRSDYQSLCEELKKRFTPVQLMAVRSSSMTGGRAHKCQWTTLLKTCGGSIPKRTRRGSGPLSKRRGWGRRSLRTSSSLVCCRA